jgi:hypothetical protein
MLSVSQFVQDKRREGFKAMQRTSTQFVFFTFRCANPAPAKRRGTATRGVEGAAKEPTPRRAAASTAADIWAFFAGEKSSIEFSYAVLIIALEERRASELWELNE